MAGFTQAQMVAYVQQGLGFRTDQSANILTMATMVQYDELEKGTSLPRFLMVEDFTLNGTANNPNLAVPNNFIREYMDEGAVAYVDPTTQIKYFLNKKPYDWLYEWSQGIEDAGGPLFGDTQLDLVLPAGVPGWYSLRNKTFFISPIPAINYQLFVTYYRHDVDPAVLASGGTNLWLTNAPGVLSNLVGIRMAEDLEYDKSAAKFQARFEASMRRLFNEEAVAEAANNEFSMGELV